MINLFDRIYIRHDNLLARSSGQQKLIISGREFTVPYVQQRLAQREAGIIGVFASTTESDKAFGGRDGFWTAMRLKAAKVIIMVDRTVMAELLIQYWKSIFKETTLDSLYMLYVLYANNENLSANRPSEQEVFEATPSSTEPTVPKLTKEEFAVIYADTQPSVALDGIEKRYLPFEILLMSYLSDGCPQPVRKELFKKVDLIVRTNIVAKLVSGREELLFETHNYYRTNGDGVEELIDDPIEYLKTHPTLSWVMDEDIAYGNESNILIKYSLPQIKGFFQSHQALLHDHQDELAAIGFIENKQYAALIAYDIADEKGNFFGTTAFVTKINGLLVSYLYQLKRLEKTDTLKFYELK